MVFMFDWEMPVLENIVEYYRMSNGCNKKKIPGCIFDKKW
jgi:hypothetical protein